MRTLTTIHIKSTRSIRFPRINFLTIDQKCTKSNEPEMEKIENRVEPFLRNAASFSFRSQRTRILFLNNLVIHRIHIELDCIQIEQKMDKNEIIMHANLFLDLS